MHSLNDISTVIKDAADVLGVDGTSEVRVAVVFSISTRGTDSLFQHNSASGKRMAAVHGDGSNPRLRRENRETRELLQHFTIQFVKEMIYSPGTHL